MKIMFVAAGLLCVGSSSYAASTLVYETDSPRSNGVTDGNISYRYAVTPTHLVTTKDSGTGIITATYEGFHATAEPVRFNSMGGTRQLVQYSISANSSLNKFNIVYDSRVELDWDASYVKYERDFYIKDTLGNVLYQDLANVYSEQDFRDYQPVSFFGEPYVGYENQRQSSYAIGLVSTYDWDMDGFRGSDPNYALFNALRGDGVVLETYERVSMYVIDKDGNDVATSLVADPSAIGGGQVNNFDTLASFQYLFVDPVPEPSSTALLALGGLFLTLHRKR